MTKMCDVIISQTITIRKLIFPRREIVKDHYYNERNLHPISMT